MREKKGFTLVELLLATAILALAVAGMLGVFSNCLFLNSATSNLAMASSHAQLVLEKMRDAGFTLLKSDIEANEWDYSYAGVCALGLDALTNEYIVTRCNGTNPLEVNVTVFWRDRFNRQRSESFWTVIQG